MRLRFGKFAGCDLEDVPLSYLSWLFEEGRIDPALRRAIRAEIADRIGTTRDDEGKSPRLLPAPDVADAAHQIVDAGYRVAAKRAHPDAGGTHAAMLVVGDARDYLHLAVERGVL
jgi:hypothetical protein